MLHSIPLFFTLALCLFVAPDKVVNQPIPSKKAPNIIFILSDDHAAQALSAYGSRINQTPNLDRIAENGMRFDRMYCTNSICAPSRAVILTSKMSHLNGVFNNTNTFDANQNTLPRLLQQHGYQTAMIGKWHLKSDPVGFDYWNILPDQGLYYNPDFIEMGELKHTEGYVTDLTTDYALNWLENRQDDKPFFLFLGNKAPHRNWMPGPEHLTDYQEQDIPEPDNLFDDYATRSAAAVEQDMSIEKTMNLAYDLKVVETEPETNNGWIDHWMSDRLKTMTDDQRQAWISAYGPENEAFVNANLQGEDLLRWKYQRYVKDYLRCIASVDDNTGRLLDYLEEKGLAEHTILVYTSDQGFYLGEHGWFDKRFMYEESYQMPFLVQWPGHIKPGSSTDALCMNLDIAPTLLELAGVAIPEEMQGSSFARFFKKPTHKKGWQKAIYYHYFEYPGTHSVKRHYGVRTERYKLIHFYYDIDAWELYDLEKDPREMNNVFDDPAYAKIREALKKQLHQLHDKYEDHPEDFQTSLKMATLSHLGIGAQLQFEVQPGPYYRPNAESKLTDGQYWNYSRYATIIPDGWVGYRMDDAAMILDMGAVKTIKRTGLHCMQNPDIAAYFPLDVEFWASLDGKKYHRLGAVSTDAYDLREATRFLSITFDPQQVRYLKVSAKKRGLIPAGKPSEGEAALLLLDEWVVE
ncbi:MAG TPA: sulfatase [Saprospiraceae bacterium]|nr:sulfatase [Saprospiraceae bacterium]HMQ85198.1 sulfatase [Saprospiraceae bacterium]